MVYDLFLFDLDDTLLDFKESERLSFSSTLQQLGIATALDALYPHYQQINLEWWKQFEQGQTSKELLKVGRWRELFGAHGIDLNPEIASKHYLETLPQTVVLIDYAVEICAHLSKQGEIGIITNGIQQVQSARIQNSAIAPYISFVSVSEACGFAKPDVRFFEHSTKMARKFAKASSLVVGDRMEADIQGAHNFGVDSCWFNPARLVHSLPLSPKYEIGHLSEIQKILQQ